MVGIVLLTVSLLCCFAICDGLARNDIGHHRRQHQIRSEILAPTDQLDRLRRRTLVASVLTTPLVWSSLSAPTQAANGGGTPLDAGEAIRRSAANIPGYGQTDVFYPESYAGTWQVTRSVEFNGSTTTLRLQYPIRFIDSIENGAVVADRGFNQAELEQAIVNAVKGNAAGSAPSIASTPAVRSYEWVPSNPNDLRIVLSDGVKKEIKVTKRATERVEDTVSSSEFQRVTQEDPQRGVPVISARRVVSKWKTVDASTLQAIELVYDMGGGDPLAGTATPQSGTLLSKSKLLLVR